MLHTALSATYMVNISLRDPGGGVMNKLKKIILGTVCSLALILSANAVAYADDIGAGGTDQGDISGTNVYTFSYIYDVRNDAIELRVDTNNPIKYFGNTTSHIFSSSSDQTVLNTQNPRLRSSLDGAISTMISSGGYNFTVSEVKEKLNTLGYYDGGNGIWKRAGGYLTYVSATKIRPEPKKHTVAYDANGGTGSPGNQTKTENVTLTLSSKKPTKTGYSFQCWTASIGGTYYPGGAYTHDQDGGTVTMKAKWKDDIDPSCSSFTVIPNYWSAGNGTISFTSRDQWSGLASAVLKRYSYVTGTWSDVASWTFGNTTSSVSRTYTEISEGVFYYKLVLTDALGNISSQTSATIYLDHSNPVILGVENTITDWTNVAPIISVSATDYLNGTIYNGSGLNSIVIKDDAGVMVASGTSNTSYTLAMKYEGKHTWTIIAKDNVGHITTKYVTTRYDFTAPGIDGTEITFVRPDGITVSGYCQDNMIEQHIDDEISRSPNGANLSSGIKSVILYRVTGSSREVIRGDRTQKTFSASDTHSYFDMHYEITADEKTVSYYEIIVTDFAGNRVKKKLTGQYSLQCWFHTSIDRSTYE